MLIKSNEQDGQYKQHYIAHRNDTMKGATPHEQSDWHFFSPGIMKWAEL